LIKRHFFLFAALCVLGLMVIAGGLRLAGAGAGAAGSDGPAAGAARPGDGSGASGRRGGGGGSGGGGRGGPVAVSQTVASVRPFLERIEVLGVAKGRQSVTITSNTTELITAVHFADGAHVKKGQVLVDLKAQAQSADIAQAQAQLNLAEINYRRWKSLGDQGIAAASTVDQYKTAVDQAQATLEAARSRLGDRVIRAPFSGVVGLTDVAPGALINPGAPIVALDDLEEVRVDFDVPDRYLSLLRQGLTLSAHSDAYPNEIFRGRIAMLDTRVNQNTRSIKARALFPNPSGRLKPGMLMHVAVDQGMRQALSVPESAVQFEGEQAFVFVIAQKGPRMVAEQRQVLSGADEGGFVEIKGGLQPGERIVADGVNRVTPNQPVRLAGPGEGPVGPGRPGGQRERASR
jgi:membrane fusion protein (multidrug efflux system)